jgi:hypothetical protein
LTPDGDLSFCPAAWTGESHFVKYINTTIKEAWQGDFMKSLRNAHLTNNYEGFDFCKQCPDWAQTRWPGEGKAYSNLMQNLVPHDLL